jgi:hypothetical protein
MAEAMLATVKAGGRRGTGDAIKALDDRAGKASSG